MYVTKFHQKIESFLLMTAERIFLFWFLISSIENQNIPTHLLVMVSDVSAYLFGDIRIHL
jgi:hypothetical protein